MKKILSRSIFLTIILLAINVAMVYGVTKNGIYTYKILSDGTISLIEYSGNAQNVIIPSTIDGKRVKKLDTNAFKNNVSVRTISLPEGLEIIDSYAFSACPNLTSISMPSTLHTLSGLFYKSCPNLKYTIPDNLTKMCNGSYMEMFKVVTTGTYNYDLVNEIFDLVNQERTKAGVKPLQYNLELQSAANLRAAEIAIDFDHDRPNSLSCFSISNIIDGENIAAGSTTAKGIMNAWMNSSGHRANILRTRFNSIAIGCYQRNGSVFWVQLFSESTGVTKPSKAGKEQNVQDTIDISTHSNKIKLKISWNDRNIEMTNKISLNIGEKISPVTVNLVNPNKTSIKTQINLNDVQWISSNEKIFTVDKNGTITPVGGGEATLSVVLGNETITYDIKVNSPLLSISMPNTAVVYTNYTTSLNVTYNPSSTTDDKNVVWTSENDNIAKVDSNGIITGINEGTTTITARVGTKIATCVVTVKKAVEENIYFSKTDETVLITESTKLLDLIFEPGINTSDDTIIWESSNSNIVEVDNNGVLKILSTGKVTITAFTKTGNAAQCEVNVIDYLKGDMDRNGVITANDAAMILDLYKNGTSSSEDIQIGDMDGNGTLTANDAAMILDMYKNGK